MNPEQCVPITTGRNFMKPKKPIVVRTFAPTQTPAATTFAPVQTPAAVRKHNTTISNVNVEAKHDSKGDDGRDDKKHQHDSDDDDSSDDSDDDRDSDDFDDHHRHHDSDDKHDADSDDSDDSRDEKKDSDDSDDSDDGRDHAHHHHSHHGNYDLKHRDDARRTFPPPTYAFYPMNKSMIFYQPYQRHDQEKDQGHSDGKDDNRLGHEQYQRASNDYQDPKHRDDARRTSPPPPSDYKYPTVNTPIIVHQRRQQLAENETEQDTAMGTNQPVFRLNRLDQNNF